TERSATTPSASTMRAWALPSFSTRAARKPSSTKHRQYDPAAAGQRTVLERDLHPVRGRAEPRLGHGQDPEPGLLRDVHAGCLRGLPGLDQRQFVLLGAVAAGNADRRRGMR